MKYSSIYQLQWKAPTVRLLKQESYSVVLNVRVSYNRRFLMGAFSIEFIVFWNIYSDSGYISHIYTQDKFYNYTTHTYINANFLCKTMQVHFNRYLEGEKCCQHWDSNPQPFDLDHLGAISHAYCFFTSLHLSCAQDHRASLESAGPQNSCHN